jgi:outer membrane receptor protein involved in Fe transport
MLLATVGLTAPAPAWAQVAPAAQSSSRGAATGDAESGNEAEATPAAVADASSPPETATTGAAGNSDIIVTGSRIQRTGFTAPTPTSVLNVAEIESKPTTNIATVLTTMPAFAGSNNRSTNSINTQNPGANFLNLRGLGTNRTLVLVNGRRHVPTSISGVVDMNVIPSALIGRLDVITGGASAAWGSDAVAGVVNIITRTDLQGLEGSIQYGVTDRGDSQEYRGTLAFGHRFADGRGRLLIAGEIAEGKGVPDPSGRSWADSGWYVISNPAYVPGNGQPARLITSDVRLSNATLHGVITTGPLRGIEFQPNGGYRPFDFGSTVGNSFSVGGDGVIGNHYTALEVPSERQNISAVADFDIASNLTLFAEGSFARSYNKFPMYPSYDFGSIRVSSENAFLPADIRARMVDEGIQNFQMGRLNVDMPSFTPEVENRTVRGVVGLRGEFGDWNWEAYYQQGETTYDAKVLNNRIQGNFTRAVDAVRNAAGQIVCRSTLTNPTNGCVPLNVFGYGSPDPQAFGYVFGTQSVLTKIGQKVASVSLSGEPLSTWAGPVGVAVGAEYRDEDAVSTVDALSAASAFSVGNPQPFSGAYNVKEAFAEVQVPLATDVAFAKSLEINGAVRHTDYSTSGGVNTWKVGVSWEPIDSIRLRATRSRDIRAPNLGELYSGAVLLRPSIFDPVTNRQLSVQSLTSGNADLRPEAADTTTAGIVLEPAFAPGFRASVDYYSINIKQAVTNLGVQAIVDRCASGMVQLCEQIERDDTGTIVAVRQSPLNLSSVEAAGVDFELLYRTNVMSGNVTARLLASYLDKLITDDGISRIDRAGDVGSGSGSNPHWRSTASLMLEQGRTRYYLEGVYVGGGAFDSTLAPGAINTYNIDSFFMLSGSLQHTMFEEGSRKVVAFLSVNNILDQAPPINPSVFYSGISTNAALYDTVGRKFYAGIRFKI